MNWLKLCDRVYIRISNTYNNNLPVLTSLDLMSLIQDVAKANITGDGECLYDAETSKFYEKRTKKFIVKRTEAFIADLQEVPSQDENMATYASLTQLNRLVGAFSSKKKQISCYGLAYVYVIYTLLEGKSESAYLCAEYLSALHNLVSDYFEDHPADELAAFFHGCFDPIVDAVREKNINLSKQDLPPRPRKRPKVQDN